jgi:hypothetical protein
VLRSHNRCRLRIDAGWVCAWHVSEIFRAIIIITTRASLSINQLPNLPWGMLSAGLSVGFTSRLASQMSYGAVYIQYRTVCLVKCYRCEEQRRACTS